MGALMLLSLDWVVVSGSWGMADPPGMEGDHDAKVHDIRRKVAPDRTGERGAARIDYFGSATPSAPSINGMPQ